MLSALSYDAVAGETGSLDYASEIYPILETYCVACHTEDDPEGGLVMTDFSSLMRGGDTGLAITAGNAGSSRLYLMASGKLDPVMPPDDAEPPTDAELELLARWIDQGAIGPTGSPPIKHKLRTPKIPPARDVSRPLTAIAMSSSGDMTAQASFGRIELLPPTGEPTVIDDLEIGKVNSLAFSPSGNILAAAGGLTGASGRIALFDVATGMPSGEFVTRGDAFYAVAFHPSEPLIAAAGYDRVIRVWNTGTNELAREFRGHNGAIFDLAFSPEGSVLASACADETVKLWSVSTGERLDTLGQPEGEVNAVAFSPDGRQVIAASADNRLRVWSLRSRDRSAINPLVATRFIDETPLVNFAITPSGKHLVTLASSGNLKVLQTSDWQSIATLPPLRESGTDLFVSRDNQTVVVAMMNGERATRTLPVANHANEMEPVSSDGLASTRRVWLDLGEPNKLDESKLESSGGLANQVERHVMIDGTIAEPGEIDRYKWSARKGEFWAIDVDAAAGSDIDPFVSVTDAKGEPIVQVRLQAVRDSYFTFRGKNSDQVNDFRVFNWQEMKLGEYFYAAGEVTRLQRHPRGPDSGFNMYPGQGKRWTYFGTSGTTHALGEPAYIVRALPPGTKPLSNGLPVFDIPYENDDDPMRMAGKNARLLFTAPAEGDYLACVSDTRGEGGAGFRYQLRLRPAAPSFQASTAKIKAPLRSAVGREFQLTVNRIDGFDGPVTFDIQELPPGLVHNFPVTVEAGQRHAMGMIWASPDQPEWTSPLEPRLTARAKIGQRIVERSAGTIGKLTFDPKPTNAIVQILPRGENLNGSQNWTLRLRPGQTVSAVVAIERQASFTKEVSFGKEDAGRNASQGVYVDNIGLNGLLILAGADEREFFITADETAKPSRRSFFLKANLDGGITSHPITVEVIGSNEIAQTE
ncbi:MAG: c-type cytochrome domain-containing protein [Planctomycetota bacterium]